MNKPSGLDKLLLFLLSLQGSSIVIFSLIVFARRLGSECGSFLIPQAAFSPAIAFLVLGLINLPLVLVYLLRLLRGKVLLKSRTNIAIITLILINLGVFLFREWLYLPLGCYGG